MRRALHNPAQHKQSVDVYRTQQQTSTVVAGDKRYLNRGPNAVSDAFTVNGNSTANALDVLPNDSDPDGDADYHRRGRHGCARHRADQRQQDVVHANAGIHRPRHVHLHDRRSQRTDVDRDREHLGDGGQSSTHRAARFRDGRKEQAGGDRVLANDSDPDGDALTIMSFTQPARAR